MVNFTAPPPRVEPQPHLTTLDAVPENDLTLAPLKAVMRAFDEALADARRLRAGLVPPSV